MLETWILPIAILMVFAILLLAPVLELAGTSLWTVTFWCPFKKRNVTVSFVEKGTLGIRKRMDVSACTAFEDAQVVGCEKRCLELPESELQEAPAR